MPFLVRWHIEGNPPKERIFQLQKTVDSLKKYYERFAGDKLLYFEVEDLDSDQ